MHLTVGTFLQKQVALLGHFRIGIKTGKQVAVTLHQPGSERTKFDVQLQAVEDGLIGQRGIFHNLAIVGSLLDGQAFQFDEQTTILQ